MGSAQCCGICPEPALGPASVPGLFLVKSESVIAVSRAEPRCKAGPIRLHSVRKSCRLCENSAQHLRGRIFFYAGRGKWPSSEAKCSYLAFFGRLFCLPLKSTSFHTVSLSFASSPSPWIVGL